MAYEFYLDGVQLPIPPSKMQTKIANQNKTINLINDGEINLLKTPGLTDISIDVIIPQTPYPFAVGNQSASHYLGKFESLKVKKKPFQFIVSRTTPGGNSLFNTNMKVSLEDYTITEDAKDGLDLSVSIKLKQYRPFATKSVEVKPVTPSTAVVTQTNTQREVTKETPKTYTVVDGDSLWKICQKQLGDGSRCYEIAELNGIKNPNLIYRGQVIKFE